MSERKPCVLNLHHFKKDERPNGIYIGRPSVYGNPFTLSDGMSRNDVIEKHRKYFLSKVEREPGFRAAVERLRGKDLLCWCAPKACHGDVILEWLDDHKAVASE